MSKLVKESLNEDWDSDFGEYDDNWTPEQRKRMEAAKERKWEYLKKKGYSNEKITGVGNQYQEFLDYVHSLNYEDLIEYAEKKGHFKTLNVLDYLRKKSKYI